MPPSDPPSSLIPTWSWREASGDFVLRECNESAAFLLSARDCRSLVGRTASEILPEASQIQEGLKLCHSERRSFQQEARLRLDGRDKRLFLLQFVAAPPHEVVLHAAEIAGLPERMDMHVAAATLDVIYTAAPLPILGLDLAGRVTKWNPAAERLFGWKEDEVLGRVCPTVPPEGMADYVAMMADIVAHGPRTGMLYLRKNVRDERIKANLSAAPLRNPTGTALGLVVIMEDATARERAATELARRKAELRRLVDSMGDIVFRLDRTFRYQLVNRAFLELTSRTRETVLGRTLEEMGLSTARCEFWHANLGKVFANGIEHTFEFEAPTTGGMRSFHAKVAPELGPDGAVDSVVVILRDTTERKRMQFEAQALREKLAHVNRVSALGELAAVLAHELNQPLTAILSNAQAAQRMLAAGHQDVAEVKEILADIVRDDKRAAEIIHRMRTMLIKGESHFGPVDLNEVILEVSELVRTDALYRAVELTLTLGPMLPPVRGDRVQLQQVVLNLMLNAMDAMTNDGVRERRLVVRTWQADAATVATCVEDTGVGIASDKLEEVFTPFFTSKVNGLGTGLFISRSLVESHGGRIIARQNAGPGATFEFTLPIYLNP